jgi:hypothetical protein
MIAYYWNKRFFGRKGQMSEQGQNFASNSLAGLRLAVGVAQGFALYLLYSAYDAKTWPATDGSAFGPMLLLALFLPVIAILSVGDLRPRTAVFWAGAAACTIALLGWYDLWRAWPIDYEWSSNHVLPVVTNTGHALAPELVAQPHVLPDFVFGLFLAAGLFIAHALIAGGDADRKFMATYPTHFDVAWKLAVQFGLAAAFVGAMWLVLWLGAGLFQLIKLDFFQRLIEHRWFAIPVTALAVAAALHVSDVRAGLVRGVRTLALILLSWLLPLMTVIGAGFLVSLVFTGLAPLWATRHAAALLLTAAATLIVLINAAYQDGHAEREASTFVRFAIRGASTLLLPIALLAAYALALRVTQYGWSVDRVASAACIVVAISYSCGYMLHAAMPALRVIETWNFITAILLLAVLIALFTPIADPARVSVGSQMAQLQSGKIKADAFDYHFLRWEGGRYGRDALRKLAVPNSSQAVRARATVALMSRSAYDTQVTAATSSELSSRLTVHPFGRPIPKGFLATRWASDPAWSDQASCITSPAVKCDVLFADVDGDGNDDILLLSGSEVVIYRDTGVVGWRIAATFSLPFRCMQPFREALLKGNFRLVEPAWQMKDFELVGVRLMPDRPYALGRRGDDLCPRQNAEHSPSQRNERR